MEKNPIDLKYEIISTVFFLLISILLLRKLGMDENTIWLSGIIICIAAIILVVVKVYIYQLKNNHYIITI